MKRILVQLLVEGKTVHMFVGQPGETAEEIYNRVNKSLVFMMLEFDDEDEVK